MLGIERVLQENNSGFPNPPYERYSVLKHRLFTEEYSRWAAQFPGGNDHGPGHVSRVLEYLDLLLGDERDSAIGVYELFLTMMAVLYHDVGLLHGRADHGDHSGAILDLETNEYIFDRYE